MKKLLVVIFGLMLCVGAKAMSYDVVPLPQSIQMQKGEPFLLNNQVQILASESLQTEAAFLQSYLKELTGLELALSQKREKKSASSSTLRTCKRFIFSRSGLECSFQNSVAVSQPQILKATK